uniref:Uncharacterized protein n=1 Tax=viral metagenome TaxID=1070528 RepID=A0A6C0IX07_9ZZZZ
MNQERFALFLIGCMGSRLALAEGARHYEGTDTLAKIAPFAFLPALGFTILFIFGLRTHGPETFGDLIWWDNLRPVHAILYAMFAVAAMNHRPSSHYLYIDLVIGLFAWITFHSFKR